MYNKSTGEVSDIFKKNTIGLFEKFYDGVPIWIENERQGHESGVYPWPGYNVRFGGRLPTYIPNDKYVDPQLDPSITNGFMPFEMRVDLSTEWLRKPSVNFVALYFEQLDTLLHRIGPDPKEKRKQKQIEDLISKLDHYIGQVLTNLKKYNLTSSVNIIIVGDHGQSNVYHKTNSMDLTPHVAKICVFRVT